MSTLEGLGVLASVFSFSSLQVVYNLLPPEERHGLVKCFPGAKRIVHQDGGEQPPSGMPAEILEYTATSLRSTTCTPRPENHEEDAAFNPLQTPSGQNPPRPLMPSQM